MRAESKAALKRMRKEQKLNTARRLDSVAEILKETQTRRYLWHLLDILHPLNDPRQANATGLHDTHLTAAFAAEASIGMSIIDDIMAVSPKALLEYLENAEPDDRWLEPDEGFSEEPEGDDEDE